MVNDGRREHVDIVQSPQLVATLDFAQGKVGQRFPLITPESKVEFGQRLGLHTLPVTASNLAFCGEDRWTQGFKLMPQGYPDDPEYVRSRIVPQTFGGTFLSSTKAAVAANASLVHGAKSMEEAYGLVAGHLMALGEEDSAHNDCGAGLNVLKSVQNQISMDQLVPAVGLFIPSTEQSTLILREIAKNKRRLLEAKFYDAWDPRYQLDFVGQHFPQNLLEIEVDENDHETHGHNASGVYVIGEDSEGMGFAKNEFITDTHQYSFAVTIWKMRMLAKKMGASNEERAAIFMGFIDDTLHVGSGIVTAGMPVFA